jgi:hypothetical protein
MDSDSFKPFVWVELDVESLSSATMYSAQLCIEAIYFDAHPTCYWRLPVESYP